MTVQRHDDPRLEALATEIVVACVEVLDADPSRHVRLGLRAAGWHAADADHTAERLAAAERDLAEASTLHPIWANRVRILEALSALIATAHWVGDQSPRLRHDIARALRRPSPPAGSERLAGLTAHRHEPMFDPLGRDLARAVQRIFSAVLAAQTRSSS